WGKSLRAGTCRPPARGPLHPGRVGHGHVRRQFQLARPDLDADELPDHRIFAPVPQLLRRRFQGRMSGGSGTLLHLGEVADELSRRLGRIFLRNEEGRRPVFGTSRLEQEDLRFRDNVLFYEYFHGDTGRGLGASHQTGWTGLIALLLRSYSPVGPAQTVAPMLERSESQGRVESDAASS